MAETTDWESLDEWFMTLPVSGGIEQLQRFMSATLDDAVRPAFATASERFDRQKRQGVPDEYLDVDSVIDAIEFGRWTRIAFFSAMVAIWEVNTVELSLSVVELDKNDQAYGRTLAQAIRLLKDAYGEPEDLPIDLGDIREIRNRLLHDGGLLTEHGRRRLGHLLAAEGLGTGVASEELWTSAKPWCKVQLRP